MPDPSKPILKARPVDSDSPNSKSDTAGLDPDKPILKAQPVEAPSKEIRKAQPVHPSDQISDDQLLKPTPPPPADLDE